MTVPSLRSPRFLNMALCLIAWVSVEVAAIGAQKITITDLDVPIARMDDLHAQKVIRKPVTAPARIAWRDQTLNRAVSREAGLYRIDPLLIHAVIEQESGGRPRVRSRKGAVGVMQLMPHTGVRFGVRDRYSVDDNVRGGVGYLVWLLDLFEGDVTLALAAYNAGEAAVLKFGRRVPPYRETQNYVMSIARRYKQLRDQSPAEGLNRR